MRLISLCLLMACAGSDDSDNETTETDACDVEGLVNLAGNAEDDVIRHAHLTELQACLPPSDPLASELAALMPIIDEWTFGLDYWQPGDQLTAGESGYLAGFFAFTTFPGTDKTFPPQPAADSPLHPIWAIYRGRMLIWVGIENGFLTEDYFSDGRAALQEAQNAFPDNPSWGMYLDMPRPWAELEASDAAPQWAVDQREALTKLTRSIRWWIDERQAEDGQFGGGWGDDVELWRRWAPVLIGFDDPGTREAWTLLSNELWLLDRMAGGYSNIMTDVQHSAEDSADTLTSMQLIQPSDATWGSRSSGLVDLAESQWWGTNELDQTVYKSAHLSSDGASDDPSFACDTPYHTRVLQPAIVQWNLKDDYVLGERIRPWLDTWVAASAAEADGKPAGVFPAAIRWPDGSFLGTNNGTWFTPGCHVAQDTFSYPSGQTLLMQAMVVAATQTGSATYEQPLIDLADLVQSLAQDPGPHPEGSALWAAEEARGSVRVAMSKYWALTGEELQRNYLRDEGGAMAQLLVEGDRQPVEDALANTAEAFSIDAAAWTNEVRFTDRFGTFHRKYAELTNPDLPRADLDLLYETLTGDLENPVQIAAPAVLWHTSPADFAALVTERGPDVLQVELFSFDDGRDMGVTAYDMTTSGSWSLTCGDNQFNGSWKGPQPTLSFQLPPDELCILALN